MQKRIRTQREGETERKGETERQKWEFCSIHFFFHSGTKRNKQTNMKKQKKKKLCNSCPSKQLCDENKLSFVHFWMCAYSKDKLLYLRG